MKLVQLLGNSYFIAKLETTVFSNPPSSPQDHPFSLLTLHKHFQTSETKIKREQLSNPIYELTMLAIPKPKSGLSSYPLAPGTISFGQLRVTMTLVYRNLINILISLCI